MSVNRNLRIDLFARARLVITPIDLSSTEQFTDRISFISITSVIRLRLHVTVITIEVSSFILIR